MTGVRECGATVPEALRGDLRPSPCRLGVNAQGYHTGEHKAHLAIPRLGRVTFRWKQRTTPPVVTLPVARIEKKPILGRPDCECPMWWSGHGHMNPCRLP